jgi:hypothetical protein
MGPECGRSGLQTHIERDDTSTDLASDPRKPLLTP